MHTLSLFMLRVLGVSLKPHWLVWLWCLVLLLRHQVFHVWLQNCAWKPQFAIQVFVCYLRSCLAFHVHLHIRLPAARPEISEPVCKFPSQQPNECYEGLRVRTGWLGWFVFHGCREARVISIPLLCLPQSQLYPESGDKVEEFSH